MTSPALTSPPAPAPLSADRRAMSIGLAVLGVFVTYVPITSVSVTLPTIGTATRAATSDLQWVSDAYVIPMAAAVLSAGVFGDRHGRKRVYLSGMVLTILGALVAGLASGLSGHSALHLLWGGQAVSGVGAGMLLPTTLALIAHAVPEPRQRGKYIGMWATGLSLGLALGPLLAGSILEFAGWGWTFAPTAVLAAAAGAFALARLPESRSPQARTLDWPGQIAATIAIAASIYATIEGGESGWTATKTVLAYVVAALALAAFVVVELRVASPLVDLALFRSTSFSAAGFSALVTLFAVVGSMFLLSLFFGYVQHLSPLQIATRLLLITGVSAVANPVVGTVIHRLNPILVLAAGLLTAAVGVALLTSIEADTGLAALSWRLAVFGLSLALILTSVSTAAINSVPWQMAGMAAATNTALRQYGGALGPAVLGTIFTDRTSGGASSAAALHTALVVSAVLLGLAALTCLVAARRSSTS